jgi:quercetin dioxygenase-like cupin family protein
MNRSRIIYGLALGLLATGISSGILRAQAPAITSQEVARGTADVPAALAIPAAPTDIVSVRTTYAPGSAGPWHHHPGPTTVTVLKGTLTLEDCTGAKTYEAGSAFIEAPGHVHRATNVTAEEFEVLSTYIVPAGGDIRQLHDHPPC